MLLRRGVQGRPQFQDRATKALAFPPFAWRWEMGARGEHVHSRSCRSGSLPRPRAYCKRCPGCGRPRLLIQLPQLGPKGAHGALQPRVALQQGLGSCLILPTGRALQR